MDKSLLPRNATSQELALEGSIARIGNIDVPIADLLNSHQCPEPLLPWLAWHLSVDNWNEDWTEKIKRNVISESIAVHKTKGTRYAIERALSALAVRIDLLEWWQNGGQPYTFELTARASEAFINSDSSSLIDANFYSTVQQIVNNTKPARAGYQLKVGAEFSNQLAIGAGFVVATSSINHVTIEQNPKNRHIGMALAAIAKPLQYAQFSMTT